jgi:hypothetical protein
MILLSLLVIIPLIFSGTISSITDYACSFSEGSSIGSDLVSSDYVDGATTTSLVS